MDALTRQIHYQRDLAAFLAIETEFRLFEWYEDDVPVWRIIRYPWFQLALQRRASVDFVGSPVSERWFKKWKRRTAELITLQRRSPERGGRCDILVVGHDRRVLEHGIWRDIYVDPILPILQKAFDVRVAEPRFSGPHRTPAATPDLRYLDNYQRTSRRLKETKHDKPLSSVSEKLCMTLQERFKHQGLDNAPCLAEAARNAVASWRSGREAYQHLLNKLMPKALVVVNYLTCQPIIAAAQACGINTIELQHGSPGSDKLNYNFPAGVHGVGFPDYFFSFGPFWQQRVSLPIAEGNMRSIGFQFLNEKRAANLDRDQEADRTVLVISQPIQECQQALATMACRIKKKYGQAYNVIWRPHPSDRPGEHLIELSKAGITISEPQTSLYKAFQSAGTVVGVYSTALFEAVAFGHRPQLIIVRNEGSMNALVAAGGADVVENVDDIQFNAVPSTGLEYELFAVLKDEELLAQFQQVVNE